jgi:RNA polymerase sigma factor (TIGR02999 family)
MESPSPQAEITLLLHRVRGGDREALDTLISVVFDQLHRLAANQLRAGWPGLTLQPTALINEAFLRLFSTTAPSFEDRAHFLGIVARVMRQVLIDETRLRHAQKRNAGVRVTLDEAVAGQGLAAIDLLAIDEALQRLGRSEAHLASLVEMRFFAGMTAEEIALSLGESVHVVRHDLRYALARLRRDLKTARRE